MIDDLNWRGFGQMPVTVPDKSRNTLDLAGIGKEAFGFLVTEFGFKQVAEEITLLRYQRDDIFVNVFHGRASYELGVEVRRRLLVEGKEAEEVLSLSDIVASQVPLGDVGFRDFTATTKAQIERFLPQLAEWTREYAAPLLRGEEPFFTLVNRYADRKSIKIEEKWRAHDLRRRADSAWKRRDYSGVAVAYEEIIRELPTVQLKESEMGRLRYAQKKLYE